MIHFQLARSGQAAMITMVMVVTAGCAAFRPAGDGGWTEAERRSELERVRAQSSPPAGPTAISKESSTAEASVRSPVASTTFNSSGARILDFADALALALRHNRSIAAADSDVDAAAGAVDIARASLLPTSSVRAGYSWYGDEQTTSVDVVLPDGTSPTVTVRERDFVTVGAAVRLAIDISGELRHGLGAAQSSYRAEQARAWATRLDEERAVASAYFGLLEAVRLGEVAAQTVVLHERQLADASNLYHQGRLTKNGVLVVEVALADSRQRLLQAGTTEARMRRALNRVVGLDIKERTDARDVADRPTLPQVEDAVDAAAKKNPLVGAMLEEVQAADGRATAARRSRFPRLAVTAGYDATSANIVRPSSNASTAVVMEVDLGSFRREGEIATLDAICRSSRLNLDRVAREIEALVRDAHDRLLERLAAIDAASVAVGQAAENLRIRQAQFDEGRTTSEDLLDAAELLSRQRVMLAAATYQAHARRAELQQLMGEPLSELAVAAGPPS